MTETTHKDVIHGLKRKLSLFRYQPCSLVLAEGMMLVAACDKSARGDELAARYGGMTVEEILAETEGNLQILDNQIQKLRVERHGKGDIDTPSSPDRIILKTMIGKQVFIFTGKGLESAEAKEILARRFGDRVR